MTVPTDKPLLTTTPDVGNSGRHLLSRVFPWVVLTLLAALVIAPIFSLVAGAFSLSRLPNEFSLDNIGFDNFYAVWVEQRIDKVI